MQRRFPQSRKLVLLLGDIFLTIVAVYLATSFIVLESNLKYNLNFYLIMTAVLLLTMIILFNVNGLFTIARKKFGEVVITLAVAIVNEIIIMMAICFFINEASYSRVALLGAAFLQFLFLLTWRNAFWRMERVLTVENKVAIIGSVDECQRISRILAQKIELNLSVCSQYTGQEEVQWQDIAEDISTIILGNDLNLSEKSKVMHFCNKHHKNIVTIPTMYELLCSSAVLDTIDDIPIFRFAPLMPTLEQKSLKRIMDIIVASGAIICTLPIMLLVAIAIKLDSQGKIIYSQIRTGLSGKDFKIYKFRTMNKDAEKKTGAVFSAGENDPRITKFGRFLRKVRLDELPQLFNVLKGEMSIVGPRPERPIFVEKFTKEIPEYPYRHNVKPGITGLAQVYGKYNTPAYDKLIYDLSYIQKYSVVTDIVIMLQTVRVLINKNSTAGVEDSVTVIESRGNKLTL